MDFHRKRTEKGHDTILTSLSSFCISDEFTDVHFSFPEQIGRRISAHKMMLAFRSPVFKAMFYGTFPQTEGDIKITDITAETFVALKRYIYTDELDLNGKTTFPLLHAAQKYQISSLLDKCETFLSEDLAVHNACSIFRGANRFSLQKLENEAVQFIANNADRCFSSDDFLRLSSKNMKDILELDSLCLTEIQIFQSVLEWTDYKLLEAEQNIDGHSRRNELIQDGILYLIAMPLLALGDFTKTVVPSGILTDEEQLYIFKAITMNGTFSSHIFPFRRRPRRGNEITLNIDSVVFQYEGQMKASLCGTLQPMIANGENQMIETLSLKSYKALKIGSIYLKPICFSRSEFNKEPIDQSLIISIKDKTFKGTHKNEETWCAKINYHIPPNEIIDIEILFESKRRERYSSHTFRNYQQNKGLTRNRKYPLSFTWTANGHAMLEFATKGTRLVENVHMVEIYNSK